MLKKPYEKKKVPECPKKKIKKLYKKLYKNYIRNYMRII